VATDAERARLWPAATATYSPYTGYQQRADEVGRTIPFVILTRRH
jgi:F420H(2)-dependent quinone reductase